MKKWLLLVAASIFLAACGDDETQKNPTIERVDTINEDVQSLVDFTTDDKFASVIYSETGTSYLLLNATGTVDATLEPHDEKLHVLLTQQTDGSPETIEDIVYAIELDQAYESIHLFEDGEEIPFEVWSE